MLLNALPPESRTQTALRDDPNRESLPTADEGEAPFGPWTLDNYQLSTLIDAVNALRYTVGVAYKMEPNPAPKPMPRPGMKRFARKVADSAAVAAARRYLDEFNRGKG